MRQGDLSAVRDEDRLRRSLAADRLRLGDPREVHRAPVECRVVRDLALREVDAVVLKAEASRQRCEVQLRVEER